MIHMARVIGMLAQPIGYERFSLIPHSPYLAQAAGLRELVPWLSNDAHNRCDSSQNATQPRAKGMVPSMMVSVVVWIGAGPKSGSPNSVNGSCERMEIRSTALFMLAVDVVDITLRCALSVHALGNQFVALALHQGVGGAGGHAGGRHSLIDALRAKRAFIR
jgi:hypothetical protein